MQPRSLALLSIGAAAGLFTLGVGVLPVVDVAYRSASLHAVLETSAGLIALLVAYLLLGRFLETCRLNDLLLTSSLAMFALSSLFLSALPAALSDSPPGEFSTWAPLTGHLLGTLLFALGAFARPRQVILSHRMKVVLAGVHVATIAAVAAAVGALEPWLPAGIDPALSPTAAEPSELAGHPVVHGVQLIQMLLFAAAAIGFIRRGERGDELAPWLAGGAVLAAFARLNYLLFPSLYSQWVYTGDMLRMGFYLLLLVGATYAMRRYWKQAREVAVLDERRRIARDLHDGLAQELAFIVLHARRLSGDVPALEQILTAGERALDESRRAIATLTRPLNEPLTAALADEAEEVAARVGLRLELDLSEKIEVTPPVREALLRIVREAVTNAARHGRAHSARIELSEGSCLRLCIRDDGVGFDPAVALASPSGFGLMSIGERARALGGELRIESHPDAGTEIEVVLP